MTSTTEAFSRVKIDALLADAGWDLTDGTSVLFEHALGDGSRADYVLCDRAGRPMAVVEAKRASVDPIAAQDQGRHYAEQLEIPFVFLSNGDEVWFLDRDADAHARPVATFYSQEDLERRVAARAVRRALADVAIDQRIVDRRYQIDCVETLSDEVTRGRRKLLVEMATGTGKTRTAAAFIKRLFEAGAVTRVLFLVDRIALAAQAEDAFTDHLRDYPRHVLRPGRGFDRAKRITIATLQTMIAEYGGLSSGYFDLVVTDECHRSIYGKWSGVLRHFDGIQLGLTATPCTAEAAREGVDPEDGHFVRDTLRFFEVERPTFRYRLRQAIAEGYLVPYRIYMAMTVKTAAEGGFEVKRGELDWSAMDEATRAEFEELFAATDTITVDPQALERKFTIPERNRALVREYRDVLDNGFTGRDGVRRYPSRGKTIVFAVTKRHAETLATMFDEHFADLKPHPTTRYADFVVSDLGGGPTPDASTLISHRLRPLCRRARRPRRSSGRNTLTSFSASRVLRKALVGCRPLRFLPSSAPTAITLYGSLSRCVLPVPFSPMMTLRPLAKSSRAFGKAVKFLTSSDLSTASCSPKPAGAGIVCQRPEDGGTRQVPRPRRHEDLPL